MPQYGNLMASISKAALSRENENAGRRLKETASDAADSVKQAAAGAADTLNTAKEQARDYAERGMEYASDYSGRLAEFVQREPWMAMAGAFVIGYAAAKLLRSVSR